MTARVGLVLAAGLVAVTALTSCTAGGHPRPQPTASHATTASAICAAHFPTVELSDLTTLAAAFEGGPRPVPAPTNDEIANHPRDSRVARCLVPAKSGNYDIYVVVLSDGSILLRGNQNVKDQFIPVT